MYTQRALRIIHSEAATSFGGQEHRILKEMMGMRERGHLVEAICQPGSGLQAKLTDEGFVVHTVRMDGAAGYLRSVCKIWRILRRGGYDVLNTHSRRDTVIAALAARLAGTPLIVRTRHLAKPPGSLWSYTGLPHKVVAISEYVAKQMRERGVAKRDLQTVFTAVNLPPRPESSTLRAELGLDQFAIVVVCVGHLRQQKGQALLIEAMATLMRSHEHLHLVFAGEGSQLQPLTRLADSLGIGNRTHFLGRRTDIPNVLAGADIFSLPTQFEALGTSFIEASAYGLPIVGTDVGGVPEVVQHGVSGILVPYGDVASLEQALGRLIQDSALRSRMGAAGARHIATEPKFTVAAMAEAMERAYLSWLKR
ncbi:glycosyltransferase [Achromobacter veterisilvae]|nr:glycosyltransferase [Achromobacter veterisilvae]